MSIHMPPKDFSETPAPASLMHPLANPFVLKVVPFWIGADWDEGETSNDLKDKAVLFEDSETTAEHGLLHLEHSDVAADHGNDVADMLDGRTGLYVVVEDVSAVSEGIQGKKLGSTLTTDGIEEHVVQTRAGLIIFAQRTVSKAFKLAA
ncbi:MAG: hypothetical protein AAFW47_05620 [Pseudomonadota bacterium]